MEKCSMCEEIMFDEIAGIKLCEEHLESEMAKAFDEFDDGLNCY